MCSSREIAVEAVLHSLQIPGRAGLGSLRLRRAPLAQTTLRPRGLGVNSC